MTDDLSLSAVQEECSLLVARFLTAKRQAGATGSPLRRLADRVAGRDRSWIARHPNTFHIGRSALAVSYSLTVEPHGAWQLTAHYTQPPSSEVSSHLVISGERGNHSGELRGGSWAGRRHECVTIVREILAEMGDRPR
jgi:hypothetical protein